MLVRYVPTASKGTDFLMSEYVLVSPLLAGFRQVLFTVRHPQDPGSAFPVELQGRVEGVFETMCALEEALRAFFHTQWFSDVVGRLMAFAETSPPAPGEPILVSCW